MLPFDLAAGPLFRGRLIRIADDDHVLGLVMHHVVSDEWSAGVLHRELSVLYDAFRRGEPSPLPPLTVQYADFAAWQREWLRGDVLDAQASSNNGFSTSQSNRSAPKKLTGVRRLPFVRT